MDIKVGWDALNARGDWVFATGDLATGSAIESAVLVSLFSDRTAELGYQPTDGTDDMRGWWGDALGDRPLGSRLWQLERAKKTGEAPILLRARDHCREALQWLIDDGVAAAVDVQTRWLTRDALGISVAVTKPDGTTEAPFFYEWAWKGAPTTAAPLRSN